MLSEALRQPLAILATVLDTYEKRDLTSEIAMSFTKEDASPNPNSISFKLVGPTPVHNFVKVTIKLGTDPSIVTNRFDTAHNKFPEDLDLKAIYNAAKVGTTSSFLPLRDAFSKEKQKDLLDYLNDMDKEKFPEGKTVKQVCQKLFDAAEDFFSVRDAPAVYASFLDRYEAVLALQSSAKTDCIDEFSTSFNKYGVPLSQFSSIISSTTPVTCVATSLLRGLGSPLRGEASTGAMCPGQD